MQIRLNTATALSEQDEQSSWYYEYVVNSHAASKLENSSILCLPGASGTMLLKEIKFQSI